MVLVNRLSHLEGKSSREAISNNNRRHSILIYLVEILKRSTAVITITIILISLTDFNDSESTLGVLAKKKAWTRPISDMVMKITISILLEEPQEKLKNKLTPKGNNQPARKEWSFNFHRNYTMSSWMFPSMSLQA